MKKVVCIVGPTGVGKSDISLKIASYFGNEIISGDSVQVYKRLDIGSAKINDYKGIKHHLIDFLEPNEKYTVCDFQRNVRKKIEEIEKPLIVGGTGLYVKAALYDYEFDENARDFSEDKMYDSIDVSSMYKELLLYDPQTRVDKNNRVRVLRALNLAKKSVLLSERKNKDVALYDVLIICLTADREIIYDRINKRVLKMVNDGLVKEVEGLKKDNIIVKAIGYNEIYDYLDGKTSLDEAIELIQKNTRHYAKRQMTWFKNQMNAIMIDIFDEPFEKCCKLIENFYME